MIEDINSFDRKFKHTLGARMSNNLRVNNVQRLEFEKNTACVVLLTSML